MKRIAIILITSILLTVSATAVVGNNDTSEDGLSVTSSSSASATAGVSPNGTDYTAKVEMAGSSPSQTEDEVRNLSFPDSKVEFKGTIPAGTPCHVLDHKINKTGKDYVLNIQTVKEDLHGNGTEFCTQVVTGINYEAEFEAEPGFQLEIQHDGETVENVQDRTVEPEPEPSLIQQILGWLGL